MRRRSEHQMAQNRVRVEMAQAASTNENADVPEQKLKANRGDAAQSEPWEPEPTEAQDIPMSFSFVGTKHGSQQEQRHAYGPPKKAQATTSHLKASTNQQTRRPPRTPTWPPTSKAGI